MNVASPIVGIPYYVFLVGSAVGILPWTFLLVRSGLTIESISTLGFDFNTLGSLVLIGSLALLPTLFNGKEKMA